MSQIAGSIAAKINAKFGGVNRVVIDGGSESEDFNAWTGEAPTVLVGVHVQLAGAYDSTIPPVVTATATTNRSMSEFAPGRETGHSTSLQRGVFSKHLPRGKHPCFGFAPKDDRSSKSEPHRVEHDRDTRS